MPVIPGGEERMEEYTYAGTEPPRLRTYLLGGRDESCLPCKEPAEVKDHSP